MVQSCWKGSFSSVNLWLLLLNGNIWCLCLLFQNLRDLEQWNHFEKDEIKKEDEGKDDWEQEGRQGHKRKSACQDDQFRRGRKDAERIVQNLKMTHIWWLLSCMGCIKILHTYLIHAFRFMLFKTFFLFFLYYVFYLQNIQWWTS